MKSYHKINRLLILTALLLCTVQSNKSYAQTRYNGAELYADYIGSGPGNYKYRVTLIIYATCPLTGTAAPAFNATETVTYRSSTVVACKSRALKLVANSPDTLNQIYCPSATNSCSSPTSTNLGFGRAIYVDTITVANGVALSSNDWGFEWYGSPRDNGVNLFTSLTGPYNLDVRCQVNNTGSFYNTSTPRYTLIPKFNVCYNQHNALALEPYDPDGDSLVTYGIQSLTNKACFLSPNISYASGYAPGIPIDASASDPFTINPYTGLTTFTPTVNGNKYTLAWKTDKYDPNTGTYLGFCMRDNEIYVKSCSIPPPGVDSIPSNIAGNTGDYDSVNHIISVCPGNNLVFNLNAYGPTSSYIAMRSDNSTTAKGSGFFESYKGATFDTLLSRFTWTPGSSDIGLHIVNFTVKDSTCTSGSGEMPRTDFQVIIRVLYSVSAGPDKAFCPGPNSLPVQLNATGTPPGTTFYWYNEATGFADNSISDSTAQNPTVTPLVTTNYVVVATTLSGTPLPCKNTDTVKVNVFPREKVNGGPDQTICLNQTAQLNPVALKPDSVAWAYDPTLNNDSLRQPLAKPVIANGPTTYFVYIIDANKCLYRDSTHVITKGIAPKLFTLANPDTVCPGGTSLISTTVQEQSCGAGKAACKGTPVELVLDGPLKKPVCGSLGSGYTFGDPTPYTYYYYSNGQRMQLIYTRQELEAAGLAAGYINSITFTVCSKALPNSDSLSNFKIGAACTSDAGFSGSFASYPFTTVFSAKNVGTKLGLNTYLFSTPYYWDGSSNLAIQICYSVLNEDSRLSSVTTATGDVVKVVNTAGTQCIQTWSNSFNFTGAVMDGCSYSNSYQVFTSSSRPATTFNVCQSASSYTYKWSPGTYLNNTTNAAEVASNVFSNTKYTVNVYANGDPSCTSVDSVRLSVDTSTEISTDPRNIILCRPDYADLSAQARGSRPISNMACGTANPQNCASPATVVASVGNPSSGGNINATPFYDVSGFDQWIIDRHILLNSGMTSGTIKGMDLNVYSNPSSSSSYNIFKNCEVRIGCTPKQSFASISDTISSKSMVLESSFDYTPVIGTLHIPFNTPYSWDTTQNIVIQFCHGDANSNFPEAEVTTTNTTYNSMIHYYSFNQYYCKGVTSPSLTGVYKTMPAVTFHYCPAPEGTFSYTWSSGLFLSDSTIQSPTAYVPKSITYKVSTQGRNHCIVSDSVNIYLPVHHFSVYPIDTAICAGKTATFHAKGGYSYQWFQNGFKKATTLSCNNCANPVSSATDSTTYQIVVSDSVSCSDTLYAKIEVKPIPDVKIINNDTTIEYGSSVQLYASGANVFTWSPTASLSNPNIVNPIASPTEPVTYTVVGLAADGCSAMDTVHVNINYRGHLFVPSAFTPNGDGKNDKFRVSNLTFEKILEFRVYNRWGQQVYEGSDNTGWDGKWKNVDQDMGSYEYLVRVGFPDGFVETFKGSVTLVR